MSERLTGHISTEEVAKAEQSYEPGRVPEPVWYEHIRLNAVVTVEITPYKIVDGKIFVYMEKRPESDKFYAGQYHMPGTMVNGNDQDLESALNRVKRKEIGSFVSDEPEQIAAYYRTTPRGNEGVFQFLMKVYEGGDPNNWFDVENLPLNTITAHKEMVAKSVNVIKTKGQKRQIVSFE